MKYKNYEGKDWWTFGAQKGVAQPPYVIRSRGRWYRTIDRSAMDTEQLRAIGNMPELDFGARRCTDYLVRTGKHFKDLPLAPARFVLPETLQRIRESTE